MGRWCGALVSSLFSLAIVTPCMAQDFDQLMLRQSQSGTPVGVQLKIPFGDTYRTGQSMQLNFGFTLHDSMGKSTFLPLTGYHPAFNGFHVLGFNLQHRNKDSGDKTGGYILGGLLAAGVTYMIVSNSSNSKDCPPGEVKDPLTKLCTR